MGSIHDRMPTPADVCQMGISDLRDLTVLDIPRNITEAEVWHMLKTCNAVWRYAPGLGAPHAELTSGLCSDGYIDALRVLRYSNLCTIVASQLVNRAGNLLKPGVGFTSMDWVIGSDHAGAALSHEVANELGGCHAFTAKGPNRSQLWERLAVDPPAKVLQVEDVVNSMNTLCAVREGIIAGNPTPVKFYPVVLSFVDRSETHEFAGVPIVSLLHCNDINTWEQGRCPLCAAGSKRLRPKQHWAELTGRP